MLTDRNKKEVPEEEKKKFRVQLDFSEEAFAELNDLREKFKASSRAEVIRNALGLMKWLYRQKKEEDGVILVEKRGRVVEPVFPFLDL